jgi:hypothetical protein
VTHTSPPGILWKEQTTVGNADVVWTHSGNLMIPLSAKTVGRIMTKQLFSLFDKQFPEGITVLPKKLITRRSCGINT